MATKCWIHREHDRSVCVPCNCANWEYLGCLSCMRLLQVMSLIRGLGRHTTVLVFTTLSPEHPKVGDKRSPVPLSTDLRKIVGTNFYLLCGSSPDSELCLCFVLESSCSCLGSCYQSCIKRLILQTKPSVHTCSTNGSRKLTVYILWDRCYQVCLPVPSGIRVNVAASHRFSSAENVLLNEERKKKKNL